MFKASRPNRIPLSDDELLEINDELLDLLMGGAPDAAELTMPFHVVSAPSDANEEQP